MIENNKSLNKNNKVSATQKWGTARLRMLFLLPLSMVITLVVFVLSMMLYEYTNRELQDDVVRIRASVQDFYAESIRYDTKALKAIIYTLRQDDRLAVALTQSNRDELLRLSGPLFEDMRRQFSITHFYFTGIDKVNLLRVHTPARYGDTIERITMNQAQDSGSISHGVELGPLGTFTLRVVSPWYDKQTHKLIGYVELGMEIDQVIHKLENFFDVQVFTIIKKEFLEQKRWEDGMRALGRTPNWNRFAKNVSSEQSMRKFPDILSKSLINGELITNNNIIDIMHKELSYRVTSIPLEDAGGHTVAQMILLTDVSQEERIAHDTVYIGIITALLAGSALFIFFYWLVGKIGKRIEHNEKKLRDIATHDGLTGLYNHKFFYTLLEDEIARATRYKKHISLLLIDIDFFKKVNDTYGHRSGDMILSSLSKRLMDRVRETDTVCRYGGEEMTIILAETDIETAKVIAEDICSLIDREPFEIEDGEQINVTVSIGVSTYSEELKEASTLVSGADKALYEAKENGRNRVCIF